MLMDIMNFITKMLWSSATPALIIAVGVYFTIRTRFVQVRRIKDMCGLIYKNSGKTKEGISGLQSFMISVSGRVGVDRKSVV